ncbi:hypothetical protein ZWY2020_006172 [Hordeum vulgare]|nr:hypothetical protein ZWY2020_006172 [Hordeum vulgare]
MRLSESVRRVRFRRRGNPASDATPTPAIERCSRLWWRSSISAADKRPCVHFTAPSRVRLLAGDELPSPAVCSAASTALSHASAGRSRGLSGQGCNGWPSNVS